MDGSLGNKSLPQWRISNSTDTTALGGTAGGFTAGSVAGIFGYIRLVGAATDEVVATHGPRWAAFVSELSAMKPSSFLRYMPRFSRLAIAGGLIGGLIGGVAEALINRDKRNRGEISEWEYGKRILLSGGVGALGGIGGVLGAIGSARASLLISSSFTVLDGAFICGLSSLVGGTLIGFGNSLILNKGRESLFA